jgi:hypothetical protein
MAILLKPAPLRISETGVVDKRRMFFVLAVVESAAAPQDKGRPHLLITGGSD